MNRSWVAEPASDSAPASAGVPPVGMGWPTSALTVLALTLVGAVIRVVLAHQSLFADELATYWLISTRGVGGVISTLYSTHAEITPPLYFVAAWVTTQLGHSPELVRLPALVAGVLSIPAVYLLGVRTVGRPAGLVAAGLVTFSPFMIYYSAEARGYGVMMLLSTISTLAMLLAVDTGRVRWWVTYAVCSSAAFYTHYTCGFVLLTQFVWLLWAHPPARRSALLANLGALAAVLPWTGGLINDFNSPTTKILSALSPFTLHDVRLSLEHWAIGYPYTWAAGLAKLPGAPALVALGLSVVTSVAVIAAKVLRLTRRGGRGLGGWLSLANPRMLLIFALVASVPVGEAMLSAFSTHIFGVRNLADAWPAFGLAFATVLVVPGPRVRLLTAALALAAFAWGTANLLAARYGRPDLQAAGQYVEQHARSGDAVIDLSGVLSPGPLTALDVTFDRRVPVIRAGAPAERDHPFGLFDPIVSISAAVRQAIAAAPRGRVFVVGNGFPQSLTGITERQRRANAKDPFPPGYHLIAVQEYPGIALTKIDVYARRR